MTYDEWFKDNADEMGLHGIQATSRLVWAAAVAAERERWESLARQALEVMENHRSEHAQSRIPGVVYAFRQRLTGYGPNVKLTGRP